MVTKITLTKCAFQEDLEFLNQIWRNAKAQTGTSLDPKMIPNIGLGFELSQSRQGKVLKEEFVPKSWPNNLKRCEATHRPKTGFPGVKYNMNFIIIFISDFAIFSKNRSEFFSIFNLFFQKFSSLFFWSQIYPNTINKMEVNHEQDLI